MRRWKLKPHSICWSENLPIEFNMELFLFCWNWNFSHDSWRMNMKQHGSGKMFLMHYQITSLINAIREQLYTAAVSWVLVSSFFFCVCSWQWTKFRQGFYCETTLFFYELMACIGGIYSILQKILCIPADKKESFYSKTAAGKFVTE